MFRQLGPSVQNIAFKIAIISSEVFCILDVVRLLKLMNLCCEKMASVTNRCVMVCTVSPQDTQRPHFGPNFRVR